jgi:hypothetical protein
MIIASANWMGLSRHRISDKARRKEAFEQLDTIQILVNAAGTGSRVGPQSGGKARDFQSSCRLIGTNPTVTNTLVITDEMSCRTMVAFRLTTIDDSQTISEWQRTAVENRLDPPG